MKIIRYKSHENGIDEVLSAVSLLTKS
jgi:hypothetical protein